MTLSVTQGATAIGLTYDTDHQRVVQTAPEGTTSYFSNPAAGVMNERFVVGATATWRNYIIADGQIVAERFTTGSAVSMKYFVVDHLGSIAVVTDDQPTMGVVHQYYDPWGKMRNADGSSDTTCSLPGQSATTRGFTGHEEMADVCLINANARIYDPTLGRFLAADPIVGSVFDLQQLNHSYVLNNPLSLTDPSGMCFIGCPWKNPVIRAVAAIIVAVVLQQYEVLPEIGAAAGFVASASTAAVVNGAIIGGIAGAISSGSLKGAGLGALQGGLFAEVGNIIEPFGGTPSAYLGSHTMDSLVSHGLVGGLVSVAGGGRFGSGFLSGGIAVFAPTPSDNMTFDEVTEGTAESAILGGAGSLLGGGKFADGAITGAFGYLFNDCQHNTDCLNSGSSGPGMTQVYDNSTGKYMWVPTADAGQVLASEETGTTLAGTADSLVAYGNVLPDVSGEVSIMPVPDIPVGGHVDCDAGGCFAGVGGVLGESAQLGGNANLQDTTSISGTPRGPAFELSSTTLLNPGVGLTVTRTFTFSGSSTTTSFGPAAGGSASGTVGWQW